MKNKANINEMNHEELKNYCAQLEKDYSELSDKLDWLMEQVRLNKKRQYGTSSEQSDAEYKQLSLFNEAEKESQPLLAEPQVEPEKETITYERSKKKGQRENLLKNLPEEIVEHHLPEKEQVCSCCGEALHEMSTEVRRELKYIPAQAWVVKHIRHVYSCRNCEREDTSTPVVTAPMPSPVLPGSLVSPSFMANVMTKKYAEGLPLYRQEQQLSRLGVKISRQTLSNWVLNGANKWLTLIFERMYEHLLKQDILCADETTLQVLNEQGRPAQSQSYLWLYRTGRDGPPIVLYDYQTTRGGEHPRRFLSGFKGYLHVDGYAGYNGLTPEVTLASCWAHSRRKFDEALKALPKAKRDSTAVSAKKGLDYCNKLFAIERDLKNVSSEERYEKRLARSRPVLDAFLAWLKEQEQQALPKSSFGKAVNYCLSQWSKLETFMEDGRLEIDNNRSERSIKPFVIGRKNWIFSNTPKGARASAITYSIIETAKENGLNPFPYLCYLFESLPNMDTEDKQALDKLLPWSTTLPSSCRLKV